MTKCGKGCMPECEYFTTGGCISPFNCMYKEESGYINSATSGSIIYTGRNLVMVCNGKRKNVKGHTARYLTRAEAEARLAELKAKK